MSLILNIDTSSEHAHVSFAKDGVILETLSNDKQKEHASFLQPAIRQLVTITGIQLQEVDAVAVTSGPGSYTGLRVGLASAKGLCYALKKPFITIGSLEVLTASALLQYEVADKTVLFCPMMDARRMEVFTAIYQNDLTVFSPPSALILDESSYEKELANNKIIFFGSGSSKWQSICNHPNASFKQVTILPESMSKLGFTLFSKNIFTGLAYSEPLYLKEFQTFIP